MNQFNLKVHTQVILPCTNLLHPQVLQQPDEFRLTISNGGYTGMRMIQTKIKFALHF